MVMKGISAWVCKAMSPSHADLYEIWPTALEAAGSDWDQRKASVGQWGDGLPPPYHRVPFNKGLYDDPHAQLRLNFSNTSAFFSTLMVNGNHSHIVLLRVTIDWTFFFFVIAELKQQWQRLMYIVKPSVSVSSSDCCLPTISLYSLFRLTDIWLK